MHRTLLFAAIWFSQGHLSAGDAAPTRIVFSDGKASAASSVVAANYRRTLAALHTRRGELLRQFLAARADDRPFVIGETRQYLFATLLHDILPAWYGTPWAFEGTSESPGQGQIACGYFVTTALRDAGFGVPRVRLAQQASQVIIRSLCDPDTIKLFHGRPMSDISSYLDRHGGGIYIVGLDCHTGFVVNDGAHKAFIHSSYFTPPRAVCADALENHNPLTQSKYRMIGKLLSDAQIVQWLRQEAMPMQRR